MIENTNGGVSRQQIDTGAPIIQITPSPFLKDDHTPHHNHNPMMEGDMASYIYDSQSSAPHFTKR